MAHLKERATLELGKGYVVAAVDFGVSKSRFVRHANALSRLSATALAPEAYATLKTYEDVMDGRSARTVHDRLSRRLMGYRPAANKFEGGNEDFRRYHKIKWIGAGVRYLANRTKIGRAITKPIRENVLREIGGSV